MGSVLLMHFITDMSRRPSPSNHCTITQSVISTGRNRTLLLGYSTTCGGIISFHAVPTMSKVNLCPPGIKFQLTYRRNSKANHTTEDRSKYYPEFLFMASGFSDQWAGHGRTSTEELTQKSSLAPPSTMEARWPLGKGHRWRAMCLYRIWFGRAYFMTFEKTRLTPSLD